MLYHFIVVSSTRLITKKVIGRSETVVTARHLLLAMHSKCRKRKQKEEMRFLLQAYQIITEFPFRSLKWCHVIQRISFLTIQPLIKQRHSTRHTADNLINLLALICFLSFWRNWFWTFLTIIYELLLNLSSALSTMTKFCKQPITHLVKIAATIQQQKHIDSALVFVHT